MDLLVLLLRKRSPRFRWCDRASKEHLSNLQNLKIITKALTTPVNEHLYAKAREFGVNEAVWCLDFAINFPSIVDEVMKKITKLPFLFYTHPSSYYEIPEDFLKFEDMPAIPTSPHVLLPASDV